MEQLSGATKKADEYALRILNGENIDQVLDGADVFRAEVEKRIAQYNEKKNVQRIADENEGLPQTDLHVEQRIASDAEKIKELESQLSKESGEITYVLGQQVEYMGSKHKIIDIIDHPFQKQQTGEIVKVYHLENEVGTPIQTGQVRKYVLANELKPL